MKYIRIEVYYIMFEVYYINIGVNCMTLALYVEMILLLCERVLPLKKVLEAVLDIQSKECTLEASYSDCLG